MKAETVTLDEFLARYATAPMDIKQAMLAAGMRAQSDTKPTEAEEMRYGLKEIAEHPAVRKHPVWLTKLRVPEICGERLAGRRSYRLKTVLLYLQSEQCRMRIAELNEQRRAREQARKIGRQ